MNAMTSKLKFGIIGVGGIAQGHIQRLGENPRAEIVALCDPNPDNIKKSIDAHAERLEGVKTYDDYHSLLEDSKPDAVVICSRHADHFPQIIDSLDSGAHVLTEKPLVNTVADAYTVLKKAKASGKVVGLAYQRHADPKFRFIRESIASGKYGAVQALAAIQQQGWKKGTKGSWRQDPALSGGGQLHDSGSHLVDILLWTTGLTADTVMAHVDHRGAPVDINDALSVRFQEGAIGTLTIVGDSMGWYEDITIWCEQGTFYIRQHGGLTVQRPDGKTEAPGEDELPKGSTNVNDNFIAAIFGEEPIAAPPICGLRTMELTEAAWKSGDQGGSPIKVARVAVE